MVLFDCTNVCIDYDGKTAVKNVTFSFEENDFLCIVGENGTGKSSLVKGLLGLIPLASGHIDYKNIKQNEMGYLPQQIVKHQSFPASVKEVVYSGNAGRKFFAPFYTSEEKCRANDNMKLMNIEKLKNKSFSELSGGEQQRVLLARALCATRKLVIFDEPVASLDPIATNEFYKTASHLNREHGLGIIMISHDIKSAVEYCNKVLHLDKEAMFFGTSDEYKNTAIYKRLVGE